MRPYLTSGGRVECVAVAALANILPVGVHAALVGRVEFCVGIHTRGQIKSLTVFRRIVVDWLFRVPNASATVCTIDAATLRTSRIMVT